MKIANELVKPPKKFRKFGKLPGRPSELIRLALEDLRAAERSRGVRVVMSVWHDQRSDGTCAVCFAGAVMRRRLNASGYCVPDSFEKESAALEGLNMFRYGCLVDAFRELGLRFPPHFKQRVRVTVYKENPAQFKRQMAQLAAALEKEGY